MNRLGIIGFCLATSVLLVQQPGLAQYEVEKIDGGLRIVDAGQPIAEYVIRSNSKPIVYPLLGPDGVKMTRDYPMVPDSENEAHDHPHHRSLWFTHGEVNDTDFWAEGEQHGITEHQEFTHMSGGEQAVIASRNLWKTSAGAPVLSDHRRFTFGGDDQQRWVDCEFKLIASHGDVHFGDTKEGTFGLRIAESMKMDAKLGGTILNSRGDTDKDTWGKAAEWVDYVGPIGDKTYGIAILCHPSTFHFPNRWHVRTYGLFAANPFGVYHFTGQKEKTEGVTLADGESLTFRYRVLLHRGDTAAANIAEQYRAYAAQEFAPL